MNDEYPCIGDLYWTDQYLIEKGHGRMMILLDVINGRGKFHCQGSREIVWENVSLTLKVNCGLPQYHKGNSDYWEQFNLT
jgi:hypothetical protein